MPSDQSGTRVHTKCIIICDILLVEQYPTSREKNKMASRFGSMNHGGIGVLLENCTPKNTRKSTKFAMEVFDGKPNVNVYKMYP